jgi:hypothetical protein
LGEAVGWRSLFGEVRGVVVEERHRGKLMVINGFQGGCKSLTRGNFVEEDWR